MTDVETLSETEVLEELCMELIADNPDATHFIIDNHDGVADVYAEYELVRTIRTTRSEAEELVEALRDEDRPARLKSTKLVCCRRCGWYHPVDTGEDCRNKSTKFPMCDPEDEADVFDDGTPGATFDAPQEFENIQEIAERPVWGETESKAVDRAIELYYGEVFTDDEHETFFEQLIETKRDYDKIDKILKQETALVESNRAKDAFRGALLMGGELLKTYTAKAEARYKSKHHREKLIKTLMDEDPCWVGIIAAITDNPNLRENPKGVYRLPANAEDAFLVHLRSRGETA